MKRLPLLLAMVAVGTFLAFNTMGTGKSNPPTKYERILQTVGEILTQGHFSPKDINDEYSRKVFKKYLEELDQDKNILLQQDVDALKKFETKIDDEIKGAPVEFFLAAGKLFNARIEETSKLYKELLSKPFDFSVDEIVVTDVKKLSFPANEAQRRDNWRKRLKYMVLDRFVESQENQEKNKSKEGFKLKSDAELEKEARERVQRIMDRRFERYRVKFNDDDKFNLFVNAVTTTMDPYTEFFPPVEKRYFDEQLSGTFFGIGASLRNDEEGNIVIGTLLTGSPAMKSHQVEIGDVVLKVAQGSETPVELTGYEVTDAVKLIRGKKGTEVRLTLKKKDGSLKTVSLIREKINQDESLARSVIINNGTSKVGYILLPEFYADFENADGNRSAADVEKEVIKLKQEKVDGIVIDLRNNGGGSLYDVVQMVGLFIEDGPIVQVKDRDGKPSIMRDKNSSVLYDGPLAVMVNEFSASASEIFAAAIQDYGRGVVLGSTSTYGKGTVQRNIGLDPSNNFLSSNSELGTLKLTLQKFYRINGGSTQLRGVRPDIVIPDQYEYLRFREKDNPDALPWDEVGKAQYKMWNGGYDLNTVKNLSNTRIANTPSFKLLAESTEWLSQQNDKEYPLQLDKYRKEQEKMRSTVKQMETLLKLQEEMNISFLKQDLDRLSPDKDKQERYNLWLKNLRKDIYLDQAVKVIADIQNQRNLAKVKTF